MASDTKPRNDDVRVAQVLKTYKRYLQARRRIKNHDQLARMFQEARSRLLEDYKGREDELDQFEDASVSGPKLGNNETAGLNNPHVALMEKLDEVGREGKSPVEAGPIRQPSLDRHNIDPLLHGKGGDLKKDNESVPQIQSICQEAMDDERVDLAAMIQKFTKILGVGCDPRVTFDDLVSDPRIGQLNDLDENPHANLQAQVLTLTLLRMARHYFDMVAQTTTTMCRSAKYLNDDLSDEERANEEREKKADTTTTNLDPHEVQISASLNDIVINLGLVDGVNFQANRDTPLRQLRKAVARLPEPHKEEYTRQDAGNDFRDFFLVKRWI
ncbi:hypothetical protein LTR05_007533 [Lithohypha guttulata]|uniref:Uncharacterized protein n=1 Tax=Lithohypha guttulata TaxID=1690604 RepID=A0AAN7SVS7_9EURO|nr:hypothetical protein LTR05_007533 [Lithohypha guttulata]